MALSSTSFQPGHRKLPASGRDFRPGHAYGRRFTSVPEAESHLFKGDAIGYDRAHVRARRDLDTSQCLHCGAMDQVQVALIKGAGTKFDATRKSWYSPDPSDYIPLCIYCHREYDRAVVPCLM